MIDITPINPAQQATPTVGPVPGITPINASVTELPENLQQLLQQIQLKAVIDQQPTASTVSVNTLQGELTFLLPALVGNDQRQLQQQLNGLFQSQRNLTVVLQPGNPPTHAILLLPDQQGSANNIRLNSTSSVSAIGPQAAVLPVPLRLQSGDQITAIILPPETAIPLLEETQTLPTGTAQPPQTTEATPPLQQQSASPAVSPQPVTIANTPTQPLPAGLSFGQEIPLIVQDVTTQDINQPAAATAQPSGASQSAPALPPAPPAPTAPTATLIQATVVGTTTNGQLVLQSDSARFYVRQPVDLPTGATVTLAVQQSKSSSPVVLQQPQQPTAFPALPDVISALQQNTPQTPQSLASNIFPNPGANLGGALLFFFSALRQGDVRSWLGNDAFDILERAGKLDLVHQLSGELRESVTQETATDQYIWRTYNLPLYAENAMHQVFLHVRDEQSRPEQTVPSGLHGQRFMLDVEMSRLGAIQIDGLSRPKMLDIVLRSEKPLPQDVPAGLRDYYKAFLESLGYAGSLGFQTGRQHWLNLKQPPRAAPMTT